MVVGLASTCRSEQRLSPAQRWADYRIDLARNLREGWADDARHLAQQGDDAPMWPEITTTGDDALTTTLQILHSMFAP